MHTLALTGSIIRSDDAVGASYTMFEMNLTTQVDEQADGIVEIASNAVHDVQMAHLSTGQWLALRVITSGKDVEVIINAADTPFRTRQMVISDTNITSVSLRNLDAEQIVVQYALGRYLMRLRVNGAIVRSDLNEMATLKNFNTFADYDEFVDKTVVAAANDTTVVDMDDIGTATFVALFLESSLDINLNGSDTDLRITNFFVLADSEITSLSLVNLQNAPTRVRVIMAA